MKTRFIFTAIFALTLALANSFSQIKVISNGNVGVGMDEPAERLQINGSIRGDQSGALRISTGSGTMDVGPKTTSFAHFYTSLTRFYFHQKIIINGGVISSYNSSDLKLCTNNGSSRVWVKSNGDVGIGDSSPEYKLDVYGLVASYGTPLTSDVRLKKEIKVLESGIDKITRLNPISFKYSSDEIKLKESKEISDSTDIELDTLDLDFCNKTKFGFSAQDIQEVCPELVSSDKDGYLSIDYNGIIPILVNAIKEQQELIAELSDRIGELEKSKK